MLCRTLIVAMLLLIYKQANTIGYKTAKQRFVMKVINLAIAMVKCIATVTWIISLKHEIIKEFKISFDHSC